MTRREAPMVKAGWILSVVIARRLRAGNFKK